MVVKTMTRIEAIDVLVQHDSDHVVTSYNDDPYFLEDILRDGFTGYEHMTLEQLTKELTSSGTFEGQEIVISG